MKLRSKVFTNILIFTSIIIIFLWVFQIIFLDDFYKMVKSSQVERASERIAKQVEKQDYEGVNEAINNEFSDFCVRLIKIHNEDKVPAFEYVYRGGVCAVMPDYESYPEVFNLYTAALEHGGTAKEIRTSQEYQVNPTYEAINIGRIVSIDDVNKYLIVTSARITPVTETVETLKLQLVILTVILIIIGLIVAFLIAEHISKPIRKTNNQAKLLANGDLNVEFNGTGYLEIEQLNETLNYAVSELSKVETLRNELIANMSHDLRTPLTMIGGFSEVIRDLPGEDTKENIQVIIDETKRLTNLVNNILELSKLQSSNETLTLTTYNISEQIRAIVTRFNTLLSVDGYEIIFECDQDVYVRADEPKIDQVIYNILGNAIHYTGADRKVYVRQIINKDVVRIEIRDTGKGIKQEDLPYVWDRYYKLKNTHKRQEIGTGLGLSIVRGILKLHNVTFGVESEKGKGAMFYFELYKMDVEKE